MTTDEQSERPQSGSMVAPARRDDPIDCPSTIEGLVRRHQVAVWRQLRMLGASPQLADDLTQETFLVWLRKPPAGLGEAALAAWLRTTARNLLRSTRRARGVHVALADDVTLEDAWQRLAGDDAGEARLAALRACLARLGSRERALLDLRYRDHLAREDIAQRLGISVEGEKSLLRRTKDQLRQCIERRLRDDDP